jgi:hypothetical protein
MLLAVRFAPLSIILLVVDAEDAFFGYPSFALSSDKFSYSVLSYKFQIFDLAHAIFRAVASIEILEPFAREFGTVAAELAGAFGADA